MVRRSERALGLAIREGQQSGDIRARGERVAIGNRYGTRATADSSSSRTAGPTDFATNAELFGDQRGGGGNGIYAVTDNVTEEEFEMGMSIAKEEGDVSRANVVRNVTKISSFKEDRVDKWEQIADFASRGFTSSQIAKTIGMSEQYLRAQAKALGVNIPADKIAGRRRIDPLKVLENTVASIEASASALDLVTYEDVTPEMAAELLERLAPGIRAIRHLTNALKEIK